MRVAKLVGNWNRMERGRTPSTPVSRAVHWGSEGRVLRTALTAGMPHLLGTRTIVLLVSGTHRRDILDRTLNGPITPDVPASFL